MLEEQTRTPWLAGWLKSIPTTLPPLGAIRILPMPRASRSTARNFTIELVKLAPGVWIHRYKKWTNADQFFSYDLDYQVDPQIREAHRVRLDQDDWKNSGNCHGAEDKLFFGTQDPYTKIDNRPTELDTQERALIMCDDCLVRRECLQQALTQPEYFGVWGSSTPADRVKMRRRLARGENLEAVMDDFLED